MTSRGRAAWRRTRQRVKQAVPDRIYYLATTALRTIQHLPIDWRFARTSRDENHWPIPPPYLRYRVAGSYDVADFHVSGREGRDAFERALETTTGNTLQSYESILDFGVGCGRIVRWLEPHARNARLYGSDIDDWAVRWCNKNLPFVTCAVNQPLPPLPFETDQFDLIYSHSVFTHLDEGYQDAWLKELRRVLRPGGIALLTVHGDRAFETFIRSSTRRGIPDTASGFFFDRESQWAGVFPDFYQNAYQAQEYTERVWGQIMPIAKYLPGGMRGTQDMVVLRGSSGCC